jgi:beta-lactamase regulating signal transducer with metallopeptidase domain
VSALDHFARSWLAWILSASWQLALLVSVVAIVNVGFRAASPRLRHALWLLVLAKVFVPPSLTTSVSVGRWVVAPLLAATSASWIHEQIAWPANQLSDADFADVERVGEPGIVERATAPATLLLIAWAVGCLVFWAIVVWRYARLTAIARSASAIDEGPVRVALEQIALDLKLRRVPELLSTTVVASPFLFGVVRPRIILPDRLLEQLSELELRAVLTHELAHWKHHDTWIGWLQVLAQSIFWFHPFLWWANAGLRHERELVCDEAVLRRGQITPQDYSESIVHVLTASRGRSLVGGSLVGVFERGGNLQNRLEDIMNYEPSKRRFTWPARLALVAFAIAFLPMAPGVVETPLAEGADGATDATAAEAPQIVETTPKMGATGVDPALKEIAVTFDRDMKKGMSWTGSPPEFPPVDESRKPKWKDKRTCVLPVKLKKGSYYRVGINAPSYQNFRSAENVPAESMAIQFTTEGATAALEKKVRTPQLAKLEPANGAMDVDPQTTELRATFNMPMSDGMSWTGSGPNFPKLPEGKEPTWSSDGLTCTLPVALEAGHDYRLGLNSQSFMNFQSAAGVALKPVVYKFRTRGAKQ